MTHFRSRNTTMRAALTLLLFALPGLAAEGFGQRPLAVGISYFAGPPTGESIQLITGWDQALVYTGAGTGAGDISVESDGIVLHRNGVYQIAVEGLLFFDADDATAPDEASGLYSLGLQGIEVGGCSTPANANVPTLPVLWQDSGIERAAKCLVTFTIEVKGQGNLQSFPLVFPRDTEVQVFLYPNDQPLGDLTQRLVRLEITRFGP